MTVLYPQQAETEVMVTDRNLAAEPVVSYAVRVLIDTVSRYLFVVFENWKTIVSTVLGNSCFVDTICLSNMEYISKSSIILRSKLNCQVNGKHQTIFIRQKLFVIMELDQLVTERVISFTNERNSFS